MAEGNAERKEVEDYLRRHNLQGVMNDILNRVLKERSEHPYDAIARQLQDLDARGIIEVVAREVLDAAGRPTVAVDVKTARGAFSATVPPATPAKWGAKEMRDVDEERYAGGGVTMAVKMVNEQIAPALIGMDPADQKAVDKKLSELDGTEDFARLGVNAVLATSMAVARAGAANAKVELYAHLAALAGVEEVCMPVPVFTVIEGGSNASTPLPFKEIMVMPSGAETFSEALRIGAEVHAAVRSTLEAKVEEGDEAPELAKGVQGGWALDMEEYEDALQLLTEAVERAGYTEQVRFAINLDGERLVVRPEVEEGEEGKAEGGEDEEEDDDEEKKYDLGWKDSDGSKIVEAEEFAKSLGELIEKYPIMSMEDPFCHKDVQTFKDFTTKLSEDLQVVGDTLVESSAARLRECEASNMINAITLKPLRVGTVTDVIAVCKQAQKLNWGVVVATMPLETEDAFVADLAVALRAGQIKAGAPSTVARVSKYNRLLRIEDSLGESAMYVGNQFRRPPAP